MNITAFSIKHYVAVLVLCVALIIIGTDSYRSLPRENFPDVKVPFVFVTTTLTDANPTDVEQSVTIPLETKLDGIEGMKEMRSTSADSISIISIEFYPEVETQVALQRVRDAVDIGKADLPSEADEPVVKEFSFTSIPVLIYQLVGGGKISRSELYELGKKIRDRLKSIRGVLDVDVFGGRDRQIRIEINPERLHFYHLSIAQVQAILRGSNRNVSAGIGDFPDRRIIVRMPGEFRNPADIFQLVIGASPTGKPVYMHDVATVRYDFEDETSRARTYDFSAPDGLHSLGHYTRPLPSISLQIKKRSGANILKLNQRVKAALKEFSLPKDVRMIKALDQSKDVRMMLSDLENGVLSSLVLILAVIFLGIGGRNAVLVALAIPFSMLMTFAIIRAYGLTLNMVVLFSLILAVGMLVDNAIVIIENIYRHLCLGQARIQAALVGTSEVAWPVITSTATTVGAFLPLIFWPGVVGKFMGFLPKTVIIVLLSSLFVALVINPTLAAMIMRVRPGDKQKMDPETERPNYPLVRYYRHGLEFMLFRPLWTMVTAVILLVAVLTAYQFFGAGVRFFPDTEPKTITCSIKPPEGASLDESDQLARKLEQRIFGAPGSPYPKPVQNLQHVSVTVGLAGGGSTSIMDDGSLGPVRIELEFVERDYRTESTRDTLTEIRRRVAGLDSTGKQVALPLYGADFDVVRPQEGPPTGKPVSIDIFGTDLGQMTRVIRKVKKIMAAVPGTVKPTDTAATAQPTLEWKVDRPRAGLFGLEQATVGAMLKMAVGGLRTGTFGHGDDEQDIVLRFPPAYRRNTEFLHTIYVPTPMMGSVPLASVAAAKLVPGPVSIIHYNRKRMLNAAAEVQPGVKADADVRNRFQQEVKKISFPPGISYRFGGAAEDQEEAAQFLSRAFVVTLFIIMLILVLQFNSVVVSSIVMTSVVLSLMGVFIGLLVSHQPFGIIMTGIGVISLAGVVVNNAIVLLDAIRRFEHRGLPLREAIITASMIRFRPVLLTAITTILGLVPMALKLNFDFRTLSWQYNTDTSQFWQSMAISVIFGLLIATVLTLGVVPSLYLLYGRSRQWLTRLHIGNWHPRFGKMAQETADL